MSRRSGSGSPRRTVVRRQGHAPALEFPAFVCRAAKRRLERRSLLAMNTTAPRIAFGGRDFTWLVVFLVAAALLLGVGRGLNVAPQIAEAAGIGFLCMGLW